jgi:hypothetical protein
MSSNKLGKERRKKRGKEGRKQVFLGEQGESHSQIVSILRFFHRPIQFNLIFLFPFPFLFLFCFFFFFLFFGLITKRFSNFNFVISFLPRYFGYIFI